MLLEGRHILGESWWTAYLDGILKFWKAGGKAADLDDAPGPKPRIVQLEDLSSLRGFVGTLLVLLSGLAKEWCRMNTRITMTLIDTTTKGGILS